MLASLKMGVAHGMKFAEFHLYCFIAGLNVSMGCDILLGQILQGLIILMKNNLHLKSHLEKAA